MAPRVLAIQRARNNAHYHAVKRYGAAMLKVAAEDPLVHKVLLEVQNLVRPPSALQVPEIVGRVKAAMATAAA